MNYFKSSQQLPSFGLYYENTKSIIRRKIKGMSNSAPIMAHIFRALQSSWHKQTAEKYNKDAISVT